MPPTPKPYIARDLEKTVAAILATNTRHKNCRMSLDEITKVVIKNLEASKSQSNETLIIKAISKHGAAKTKENLTKLEKEFVAQAKVKSRLQLNHVHKEKSQLRVLRDHGIKISYLSARELRPYRGRVIVKTLIELRNTKNLHDNIKKGSLETDLTEAWQNHKQSTNCVAKATENIKNLGFEAENLRDALVISESEKHIRLVIHEAKKYSQRLPNHETTDLFGWGWQGLRSALLKYEPSKAEFSTYACIKIKGAIQDGVRSESIVPKRLLTEIRKVKNAEDQILQEKGREAKNLELVKAAGGNNKLQLMDRYMNPKTIEGKENLLQDSIETEVAVLDAECAVAIQTAIKGLTEEEQQVVQLKILENRSVKETIKMTGLGPYEIRKLTEKSLQKLSTELSDWEH